MCVVNRASKSIPACNPHGPSTSQMNGSKPYRHRNEADGHQHVQFTRILFHKHPILPQLIAAPQEKRIPHCRADESVHTERQQPHSSQTSGNGNEVANHRNEPADKNRPRTVSAEPPFGPLQVLVIQQEVAPHFKDDRSTAKVAHVVRNQRTDDRTQRC